MRTLLRLLSLRHVRRHPFRALLGVISVALGVALYVAVEVTYASSLTAFSEAAGALAGRARLQVSRDRPGGIEAEALARIEKVGGLKAAPSFHATTTLPGLREGPLMVVGVDFGREGALRDFRLSDASEVDPFRLLVDPGAVLVTRRLAGRHGWTIGSTLTVNSPSGLQKLRVAGLLADTGPASAFGGNLAVMAIGVAQRLFGRAGFYDRIDVAPDGEDVEALAAHLRAALGPDYRVEPVSRRNSILEELMHQMRTLVAIGMIALVVGLFLIYNSVSISVVERAREIGILRSLGAERGAVLGMILTEALVVGVFGSAAGVGLGAGLARLMIRLTSEQINALIFIVPVDRFVFSPATAITGLVMGLGTALLAAAHPGWQAACISPLEAMRPSQAPFRLGLHARSGLLVGLLLIAACAVGSIVFPVALPVWAHTISVPLAIVGTAMALPQLTLWLAAAVHRPLRRLFRLAGVMAVDSLVRAPQRTSLTVVALAGALGMMVATATAAKGFGGSITAYLERVMPFDLVVASTDMTSTLYSGATYPRELSRRLSTIEGVEMTYALRAVVQPVGGTDVLIVAADIERYQAMQEARGRPDTELTPEMRVRLKAGEAVAISGNLGALRGWNLGDPVTLSTRDGPRTFAVAALIEDYSWPAGTILMDFDVYARLWGEDAVTYTDLRLAPGVTAEAVKARIAEVAGDQFHLFVFSKEDLHAISDEAVAQSFRVADLLIVVAGVTGVLGLLNTLLISVLRRTREIGLLRAVGMTRGQVAGGVVVEALLVGIVGGVLGALGGVLAAWYPMSALTLKMTGFLMPHVVPWGAVAASLAGALAVGLAAGALPAHRAARIDVLEAIAYE